jgi:hypothetical protein
MFLNILKNELSCYYNTLTIHRNINNVFLSQGVLNLFKSISIIFSHVFLKPSQYVVLRN